MAPWACAPENDDCTEELRTLLARVVPPVAGRPKTAVPAPSSTPGPLGYGAYRFVDQNELSVRRRAVVGMRQEELLSALERLSFYREPFPGFTLPYGEIRTWWCLINLRLNEIGLDCPGFRPNRRVALRHDKVYTTDDTLLTNDRQMIDLHWLWQSGTTVTPRRKHRAIFESVRPETEADYFPWDLAAAFVSIVGGIEEKLGELRLHEDDQLCLMALCSDRVKKRREDLMQRSELLGVALHRRAARPGSRLAAWSVRDWVKDYVALRVASGKPSQAAHERLRLFGETFDSRHFANVKRDLKKFGYPVR
jgi:hypothetical protein